MSRSAPTPGLAIRPGEAADLPAVAELYLAARRRAVPSIPPLVHADDAVRAWVGGWDLGAQELWVGQLGERLSGFALLTPTWLDHLYVDPDRTGEGIGSALLEVAKTLRPGGLGLWAFESNLDARRFYARHGFVEIELTDGSGNEERAPDIHLHWAGPR